MSKILPFFIIFLMSFDLHASNDHDGWFSRKSEGWHFYKDPPKDPEPVEEQKKDTPPPPVSAAPSPAQGPAPMSNAWLRKNLQLYLDAAMDNPTDENILAHKYLEKLSVDKASVYAHRSALLVTGNYDLDQNNRRSLSTFSSRLQDSVSSKNAENLVHEISKRAGLFYFLDDSEQSTAMTNVVNYLVNNFNFSIRSISLSPIDPSVMPPNLSEDTGHSEMMKVQSFPSLALMSPDGKFDFVSQNTTDLTSLGDRIIQSAYRLGVISKSEYDSTKKFNARDVDTPKPVTENNLPIPPSEIISSMRTAR